MNDDTNVAPIRGDLDIDERLAARAKRKAGLKKEQVRRDKLDLVTLDDLEQEHGDDNVRPVFTSAGMVVIRKPERAWVDAFQESYLRDGKEKIKAENRRKAAEKLARLCLIHPTPEVYAGWCDEYGGIPSNVGAEAAKFADVVLDEEREKA